MEQQHFDYLVDELREFEGVEEIFVLDSNGNILFKSEEFQLSNEEAKAILKAWKEKKSALLFQSYRFAILKNDEIQLAAKNIVGGKGNIVGSITKKGDYLIAHTQDKGLIVLEWSIFINKVAWS
ncbi:MAG: hypothetical protein KGD61_04150 [Candidatus Lokiarchaeota archaeon]|nr:hypothetical protein [Candidatus Lokiarchaeota archaeon]